MKKLILFLVVCVYSTTLFSQNITNTLGTGGVFKIKDASNDYFTLSQSTGNVGLFRNMELGGLTNSTSTRGVITKNGLRIMHNYQASGTDGQNTFIGLESGNFTMSGSGGMSSSNTAVGYQSLYSLTMGYENSAFGVYSLHSNTTGSLNSASGVYSLSSNTTGSLNSAFGWGSLFANIIGDQNSAFGYYSLHSNTNGIENTAVGVNSLSSNTIGIKNTALGSYSLFSNTTGPDNTASGYQSLYSNTRGTYNTASGSLSLYSNTEGHYNTASGSNSLYFNTTGFSNTATGNYSLCSNTTGSSNTAMGYYSGSNITIGNNLTCLGYNAQPTSSGAANQITLGDGAITSLRCNVTTITSLSDARDKKNIKDLNLGINFLMKIKPRLFNWDKREWYENNKSDGSKMQEAPTAGFIAQELDEAQTTRKAEWLNLVLKDNSEKWEATPGNLLPIMVKAIQDLKKENDELKVANEELKIKVENVQVANEELKATTVGLTDRLTKFEQMQNMLVAEIEKLKTNNNETTKVTLGEK
jgi:hypothetical protein